jgi:hypothetical protein
MRHFEQPATGGGVLRATCAGTGFVHIVTSVAAQNEPYPSENKKGNFNMILNKRGKGLFSRIITTFINVYSQIAKVYDDFFHFPIA